MARDKAKHRGPVFKGERLTPAEKRLLRAASSKIVEGNREEKNRKLFKAKQQKPEAGDAGTRTAAEIKRIRAKVKRLAAIARQDVETRPKARTKTSGPKPTGANDAELVRFDKEDQRKKLKDEL